MQHQWSLLSLIFSDMIRCFIHVALTVLICGCKFTRAGRITECFGLTCPKLMQPEVIDEINTSKAISWSLTVPDNQSYCEVLGLSSRQLRLCRQDNALGDVLTRAVRISAFECQRLFRYERWNCSLGAKRLMMLSESTYFKETSFLYTVTSAGLVHSLARACSLGELESCTCDNTLETRRTKEAWLAGSCGDNVRAALNLAGRFQYSTYSPNQVLSQHSHHVQFQHALHRHNFDVGFRVVRTTAGESCRCHGVSGACTVRSCWLHVAPFRQVGDQLKRSYERASRVTLTLMTNSKNTTASVRLVQANRGKQRDSNNIVRQGRPVYTQRSPNYCTSSDFSHGTKGRLCENATNCDMLCCGRGHEKRRRLIEKSCNCHVIWCCEVKCSTCQIQSEFLTCK